MEKKNNFGTYVAQLLNIASRKQNANIIPIVGGFQDVYDVQFQFLQLT